MTGNRPPEDLPLNRDPSSAPTLLREIILQSADPLFFLDREGRIRVWNRGAELLFGWSADEALGHHADILIPEGQSAAARVKELEGQLDEAVVVQNYETTFRSKGGRRIPVKITITLIRDGEGQFIGSSVSARDVTQEKSLEGELLSRIREVSLVEQVMQAAQGTLDLQRVLRVILTAVTAGSGLGFNRAFLFLVAGDFLQARLGIGSSSWEEAGRMWPRLASITELPSVIDYVLKEEDSTPTQAQRVTEGWKVPLSDTQSVLVRCLRGRRSLLWPEEDGDDRSVAERLRSPSFAVAPLVHAAESIGVVVADNVVTGKPIDQHACRLLRLLAGGMSSVIANTRLYEKVLQHARNLEVANRQILRQQYLIVRAQHMASLGEIAATISHEVKQPLVPIGGFARAMRRTVTDGSAQAEMLDIIIKEVDRLERVVKGVIALAALPLPALRPVSFERIVDDVYDMYRDEAEARDITLAVNVPGDLPPPHLDDDQWHQLLLNLVSNAMAATPTGGTITTGIRVVEDGWYRVTITDTGVGVDEESLQKVFGPLYSTKPTGGGMGLNIVAQIAKRHHGRAGVQSRVGEGTTVWIDVPPPERLHALIDEERRATERQEEDLEHFDPLTVATLKAGNHAGPD